MQTPSSKMREVTQVVSYVWRHPSNKGRRTRALGRAVAWQAYKRLTGRPWDIALTEDTRIRCYPRSTSASCVLYGGLYDFDEMQFMRRYLRCGDNFLDVGANVGVYSLLASSWVGTGQVHAFEPSSESKERLQENLALNARQNVVLHPAAASDGLARLRLSRGNDTANRIVQDAAKVDFEEVPAVRLDDEVGHLHFSMGKMDIEGGELPALKGAAQMLARQNPPVWLLEVLDLSLHLGYRAEDLARFMEFLGYLPHAYSAEANQLTQSSDAVKQQNVLFIATAHRDEVLSRLEACR